jgi:predicted RNase H-like HicB family nuclease
MTLKVIIEPGEDSGFIAHVPALPGCWSQGQTRQQAIENAREAIAAWLEVEQDKPTMRWTPPTSNWQPTNDHHELDRGLLRGLIRDSGMTVEQFLQLLP